MSQAAMTLVLVAPTPLTPANLGVTPNVFYPWCACAPVFTSGLHPPIFEDRCSVKVDVFVWLDMPANQQPLL